MQRSLHIFLHLILIATLPSRSYQDPILQRRTWDPTEVELLLKVAELVNHEVRIWPQAV